MTAPVWHELAPGSPGGRLVVLAHGLEDSWESWVPLATRLDPEWRIVALDLPWRPGNDYRWRSRRPAAWFRDALAPLGRPADVVVAHSFGANAVLDMLGDGDPCVGDAAVLICPLYRPPDVAVTWRVFDRARRAFEKHIHDSVRSRLEARSALPADDVVDTMVAMATDRVGPSGFLAVFEQFVASGSLPVERITADVLVLAGGADPTLSPPATASLARRIPRADLLVDDDHDHFCYVRRPAEIAGRIMRYLAAPTGAPHRRSGP